MLQRRTIVVLLIASWIVTRLVLVSQWWFGNDVNFDVILYEGWAQGLLDGSFPSVADTSWQYPPGVGALILLPLIGPLTYEQNLLLIILFIDAVMAFLLIRRSRETNGSVFGPAMWIAGIAIMGPLTFDTIDMFPTALAMAVILLTQQPIKSGIAAGLGAIMKIFPGFMLLALPRRQFMRALIAAAATFLLAWLVLFLFFDQSTTFLSGQGGRGIQIESLAAVPFTILQLFGLPVSVGERYGSIEFLETGVGAIALVFTIVGALSIMWIAWLRLRGRLELMLPGDVAVVVLLTLIVMSRVNSPQYGIWISGILAVALLDKRSKMAGVAVVLTLMVVMTRGVYDLYPALILGDRLVVAMQLVRIALLIAAFGWALRIMWKSSRKPAISAPQGPLEQRVA